MEIAKRKIGKCVILDCSGTFTLGFEIRRLKDAILEASDQEVKKVILNLLDADYIDSAGIGVLVGGHMHLSNLGIEFALLNISKRIKRILVIAKLDKTFSVFESEDQALIGCQ